MTLRNLPMMPVIILAGLLACAVFPLNLAAQSTRAVPLPSLREPALDRLVAPIALYPDTLLEQVLMASTYPLDVAEAVRWTMRHPAPTHADIAAQRWENSVKALLPFMPILTMLDKEKSWARQLAAAVVKQPDILLQSIQALRERAYDNGALRTVRQQQVARQNRIVTITPADKRLIYVPYYDPEKVYGAAGNSVLPPEYWAAQPYAAPQNNLDGVVFSVGVAVHDRVFHDARIDWRTGRLLALPTSRRSDVANGVNNRDNISSGLEEWRHDPQYRKRRHTSPAAVSGNNGYTVGTEIPPNPAASVSTRDAGAASPASGGYHISTQPRRANGF